LESLALAQARKTEAISGRIKCRSEGSLNEFIVSKSGEIHKAKPLDRIEFIPFLFSGLRVVCGLRLELLPGRVKWPEIERLYTYFRAIAALSPASRSTRDGQIRIGITT
jgi:hypothetical protein